VEDAVVELLIAVSVVAALAGVSLWAERRFHHVERLPMQWSFQGRVNWTAPRRLALAFTPTLGALVLGSTAIMTLAAGPPSHGEDVGVPVLCLIGLTFLGAHGLHLWLIERSFR
jgi:hypothetical protein